MLGRALLASKSQIFEDNRRPRRGQGEGRLLAEQTGRFQYFLEPRQESGTQRTIDDPVVGR